MENEMKYDKYRLFQMVQDGFKVVNEQEALVEESKKGVWRGGNAGCITDCGKFLGSDPRKTVLRYLGIQTKIKLDTKLMFQYGVSNEDGWNEFLGAAGTNFKCESEIPMVKHLDGEIITGRPDCVIGYDIPPQGVNGEIPQQFVSELLLEHKQLCSYHSVMRQANFIDNRPKTDNVIQTGTYSNFFNVPAVLCYTNRVNWYVSYGNPTKSNPEGRFKTDHKALVKDESGRVYNIKPFISLYDITWSEEGVLHVDDVPTLITADGIDRYYRYCMNAVKTRTIPQDRSGYFEYDGKSVPNDKNASLQYDDFKEARTNSWDLWIKDCKHIADKS